MLHAWFFFWICKIAHLSLSLRLPGNILLKWSSKGQNFAALWLAMMMMLMTMMIFFCGMVDRRKAFSLISSQPHCQRSSPWRIYHMSSAGSKHAQNLSWSFVKWSCAVVITTTSDAMKNLNFIDLEKSWCREFHCL